MENGKWTRIEDVFPIENGDFPIAMLVYWRVYNRDPKIMVYEIIPTSLGSISFPINPQPPGAFFHCSCDKTILGVVGFSSHS